MLAILMLASLAAAPAAPTRASANGSGGARLVVRGVATLPSGAPVARAKVTATARDADGTALGGHGFNATSDDSGRFALEVALPDRPAIARRGYMLNLWAQARGLHFDAPDGQASLGLDLHLETLPDGTARVVGTANDARLAASAARAVATGARVELAGVRFTGVMGESPREPVMPRRLEVARVAVSAPSAPAAASTHAAPESAHGGAGKPANGTTASTPATGGAAAGAATTRSATSSGATPAPATASTKSGSAAGMRIADAPPSSADSLRITGETAPAGRSTAPKQSKSASATSSNQTTRSKSKSGAGPKPATTAPVAATVTHASAPAEPAHPAPAPAAAATDSAACTCRVTGTVEATAGDPLPGPLRVAVGLVDAPAFADTVVLDMGSPRPFELRGVPCGMHRLEVRPLSEKPRYQVRDADRVLPLRCARGERVQVRIELVAR